MPESKNIEFNKARYDQLTGFVDSIAEDINTDGIALGITSGVKLDATLASTIRPGSQAWSVAKNFSTAAGVFGGSANQQYKLVADEHRLFADALVNASDVFQDTDDLATMEASKFQQQHPDVSGVKTTVPTTI
ncbi:hypothetical protein [Kineosporia sp. NBRC 101731]|uniref:hypothetical protein n=1 Tax=Kineosporia sp. NBRC 101731 TaxID=3032199 RepID=UPI0024A56945|nr:hypothetical protein [Kineosporia sp. NBRC 101731]GLY28940.1 hypothetical protein Kisp02_23050 [Kineosporia sp. NBRC 101731]